VSDSSIHTYVHTLVCLMVDGIASTKATYVVYIVLLYITVSEPRIRSFSYKPHSPLSLVTGILEPSVILWSIESRSWTLVWTVLDD
jgi:hypothetical protein